VGAPGRGFPLLFEALALTLRQSMPVAHAALLRVNAKQLWRRIEHYVGVARTPEDMNGVAVVGIDDLNFRRGQVYVTLVRDLEGKRLRFMTEGRKHGTVIDFKADLIAHGGDPDDIKHDCMDMSAAYIKGVTEMLPQAQACRS
jgi:transposase